MDYQHIIYEPGKVARIILNRPRFFNAQGWLMREEMDDAFARAAADDTVGAVVLSGAGPHFSAGHDIGTEEDQAYRVARGRTRYDVFMDYQDQRRYCVENSLRWRNLPKPTVAMVHGYCIFGGWIFASAMDLIFAAEDALFLPGLVQYFSAPWDLGPRKAKEILFEHRFINAREAMEYGYVNRVYPAEELEAATLAYAGRVADRCLTDPMLIRIIKGAINHAQDTMGYTAEIETAYNHYKLGYAQQQIKPPDPKEGGFARTTLARKNYEASKEYLAAEGLLPPEKK